MLSQKQIGILGTGVYVPEAVLTNQDLEKLVETSAEWIVERSGIHERRIAAPDEDTVTMAVAAGRQALADAGLEPEQLSYIILGTNTPPHFFPAGAIQVQEELGIGGQGGGLRPPGRLLRLQLRPVRGRASGGPGRQVRPGHRLGHQLPLHRLDRPGHLHALRRRGRGGGGGPELPGPHHHLVHRLQAEHEPLLRNRIRRRGEPLPPGPDPRPGISSGWTGRRSSSFAVNAVKESIPRILEMAGMSREDIDYLIIHQGNYRILEAGARFARVPMDKVFVNIHRYGNTSAASVPIALHEALQEGKIKAGDKVVLISFGAGATWGATLLEW